jgi:mono/diheme cytochrome c family protein
MPFLRIVLLVLVVMLISACANAETVIPYEDVPQEGDPVRGEDLFNTSVGVMPACSSCHVEGAAGAPLLDDYASVAGTRVEGQSAHEYTFYAIAEPGQYIVEGYGNAMYNRYDDNLTPQDIADMIAYLLQDNAADEPEDGEASDEVVGGEGSEEAEETSE